jgi:hypothetical protein
VNDIENLTADLGGDLPQQPRRSACAALRYLAHRKGAAAVGVRHLFFGLSRNSRGWPPGVVLKVLVVRYGAKYYATNRLTLSAAEVRLLYRVRSQIEEVIRVCKDQLGLTGCQTARSGRNCII